MVKSLIFQESMERYENNMKKFINEKMNELKKEMIHEINELKKERGFLIKKEYENENSLIDLNEFSKIVIYQFGKVGSSTLKETFKSLGKRTVHSHTWKNEFLFHKEGRSLIINVVRKIQDRNISAFFQNIKEKREKDWYYTGNLNDFKRLSAHFEKGHLNEMKWIKNYYKAFENYCGISIFDEEWDVDKRYLYFPKAKCNSAVLILRYEDIAEWEDIFWEIFGVKINLLDANRSEDKNIYPVYQNFKNMYEFNDRNLEEIWDVDFMKFFYPVDYLNYCERLAENN